MRVLRALAGLWLAAFCAGALAQTQVLPDCTRLVDEQGNAVVNISTAQAVRRSAVPQVPGIEDEEIQEFFRRFIPRQQPGPGQGPGQGPSPRSESRSLGSGFIISHDGYILTNAHVVEAADEINVKFTDKREFKAKVIGADKRTDVALIKIEGASLPMVKFGDPAKLKVGEWVLATSFGLDRGSGALVNSVEKGSPGDKAGVEASDIIVTFDGKAVESSSDLPRIVGSTRPGSQSSVEVWRKGAKKTLTMTVGELQEDRVAAADKPRAKPQAEAPANRLGIVVGELSAEQKKGLSLSNGVVVLEVRPDSKADVGKGDILLTLVHKGQHTELKSVEQLNKLLAGLDKSAVITLQVRRGETTAFVTISGLTDKG